MKPSSSLKFGSGWSCPSARLPALIVLLLAWAPVVARAEDPQAGAKRQMQTIRIDSVTVTPSRIRAGTRAEVRVVVNITAGGGRTGTVSLSHDAPLALAEIHGLAPLVFDGTQSVLECKPGITAKKPGRIRIKAALVNFSAENAEVAADIEVY